MFSKAELGWIKMCCRMKQKKDLKEQQKNPENGGLEKRILIGNEVLQKLKNLDKEHDHE